MKDNHKADVSHTNEFDKMYQEMVKQVEDKYKVKSEYPEIEKEGLAEDEMIDLTSIVMETVEEKTIQNALAYGYNLPDGYQFVDENGNVINAKKIVLEKKKTEYPKTYEECYKIMGVKLSDCYIQGYKSPLLEDLQKLLICRDAYWKIAGDWKPDYDSGVDKLGICTYDGVVQKSNAASHWERHLNKVLEFPTKEMRDAFYENFKDLIEECKELL